MSNLAMQEVMKIRGFDKVTDRETLSLQFLKDATFTNGKETTYVTANNVKLAAFDFGANATIAGSSAFIQDDLIAAQLGKDVEVITSANEIRKNEIVTIQSNIALTKFTGTGTAGAEIRYASVLDQYDGKTGVELTQAGTASATEFSYDTSTKTITTSGVADGTKLAISYYPEISTARKIENITTNYTKTLRIEADMIFLDTCTKEIKYGKLVADSGKVSGAFEWSTSEGSDPAIQNFEVDILSDCSNNLWKVYFYDEDDFI